MTCRARLKAGFVAILTVIGSGCTTPVGQWQTLLPRPETYTPSAFAHRLVSQDVEIYWSCSRPQPTLLRVDGIAKNIGKGEVRLLQMELHDVDRQTGVILQSGTAVPDISLHPDNFSPVQVELQPPTANGQVDMLYTYRITSIGILKTTNMNKEHTARDVCSAEQHPNTVQSQ